MSNLFLNWVNIEISKIQVTRIVTLYVKQNLINSFRQNWVRNINFVSKLQLWKIEFLIFWHKISVPLQLKCSLLLLKQDSSVLTMLTMLSSSQWHLYFRFFRFKPFIYCPRFLLDLLITLEKPILTSWSLSSSLTHLTSFLASFIVLTPSVKSIVSEWSTNNFYFSQRVQYSLNISSVVDLGCAAIHNYRYLLFW